MAEAAEIAVKNSILNSTKKMLGLDASYDVFDLDITTHINSAFSTLYQAGVGPVEGFSIEDETDTWDRFIGNKMHINDVKTYIFLRVKMLFDPPSSSFGISAVEKQIEELIWRLNVADDFSVQPSTPIAQSNSIIWDLTGGLDFPEEAPIGSTGIDTATGDVWRKS